MRGKDIPAIFFLVATLCISSSFPAEAGPTASDQSTLAHLLSGVASTIEGDLLVARQQLNDGNHDFSVLEKDCRYAEAVLSVLRSEIASLKGEEASGLELKRKRVADRLELLQGLLKRTTGKTGLQPSVLQSGTRWSLPLPGRQEVPNDNCENALLVDYGDYGGVFPSTPPDGSATCGGFTGEPDVWYRFTAYQFGTSKVWLTTEASDFDTVLSVHRGCPGTSANEINCDDDSIGLQSDLVFDAEFGHQYWIRVSGSGAGETFLLHVRQAMENWSGTVRRVEDGQPVYGARIRVFDLDGDYLGSDYSSDYGHWEFRMGEALSVHAIAGKSSSYIDQLWDHHDCIPDCSIEDGDLLPLGPGKQDNINFDLSIGGRISGRVFDAETGEAISGVTLQFYGPGSSEHASTNADGEYSISLSQPGEYCVFTRSSEYQDEVWDDVPCMENFSYPSVCSCEDGTPVVVVMNQETPDIDFGLRKMARLKGTVRDRVSGEGLAGIDLRVYDIEGIVRKYAQTSSDGTWKAGGLPGGTYYLAANVDQWARYQAQNYDGIDCLPSGCYPFVVGTAVPVADLGLVEDLNFSLQPNGKIGGRVVDQRSGEALAGVTVAFFHEGGSYSYESVETDTDGNYLSEPFRSNGDYYARAWRSGWLTQLYEGVDCPDGDCSFEDGTVVEVTAASTTGGIDFQLKELGVISGRVSDREDGSPVSTCRVYLYDSDGNSVTSDRTDSSGEYLLSGIKPGEYFLSCEPYQDYLDQLWQDIPCWQGVGEDPGQCSPLEGTALSIDYYSQLENIDFHLDRGGVVRGTVRDQATGSGISQGSVCIVKATGEILRSDSLSSGGDYEIENIPPGDWIVVADTGSYADEVWMDRMCAGEFPSGCDLSSADPVHVDLRSLTEGIDFNLVKRPVLSGRVLDSLTNAALSSVRLRLYEAPYSNYRTGYTDSDGYFSFEGVNPGAVFLFVGNFYSDSEYVSQLWEGIDCPGGPNQTCPITAGTPIMIEQGQTPPEILVRITRKGSISGTVTDQVTGSPLWSSRVEAWRDGVFVRSDYTDEEGHYQIDRLQPGNFAIIADAPYGTAYLSQLYSNISCVGGLPDGCNGGMGTPVEVRSGADTPAIDFQLESEPEVLYGRVFDDLGGEALGGITLSIGRTGSWYTNDYLSDSSGWFRADLASGDYQLSTSNALGYRDEVFDDIPCNAPVPWGDGFCDRDLGTELRITPGLHTPPVEIRLLPFWLPLFSDGFENGNLKAWSGYPE